MQAAVLPHCAVEPTSTFVDIRSRLGLLADAFELGDHTASALEAFDAIFEQSLAFPLGQKPSHPSRLNEDGTPIQFATTVGAYRAALRFVGEPGTPGTAGKERYRNGRECMMRVADIIGAEAELEDLAPALADLAPESDPVLLRDTAGVFWVGAAFAPAHSAQMRIYVNASWGRIERQWERLRQFASFFGQDAAWKRVQACLGTAMTPLGVALTLTAGRAPKGAIYFRAFGNRLSYYQAVAGTVSGQATARLIGEFGAALLGADMVHPTPSAVCSVGFGGNAQVDFEFELCGHCLFSSDKEGQQRLLSLFNGAEMDPSPYLTLLDGLSEGGLSDQGTRLHSFVGISTKGTRPAYSVYAKPDLVRI